MKTIRRLVVAAFKDVAGMIARQVILVAVLYLGMRYVWRRLTLIAGEPVRNLQATYAEARREVRER